MESLSPFILFKEKARKLLNSSFVKSYQNNSGVDFSWKQGQAAEVTQRGPNEEQTDAFVLTFRFFIQKNETISFFNMSKAFESEIVPDEISEKFTEAKEHLNAYLDSNTMFKVGDYITRRQLLDVFIYGELSHTNEEKRKTYNKWMSNAFIAPFMRNEFTTILFEVLNVISFTGGLCDQVLHRAK